MIAFALALLPVLLVRESLSESVAKAMREGTRVLQAFGVPGPHRRVRLAYPYKDRSELDVVVKSASGREYSFVVCLCGGRGRFSGVQRSGKWNLYITDAHPKDGAAPERQLARATLATLRLKLPHAMLPGWVDPWGKSDRVSVASGIDGYPFLEGEYVTTVLLDAKTGEFEEYRPRGDLPRGDPAEPKLSEEDALTAAKRILVDDPPSGKNPRTEFLFAAHKEPWLLPFEGKRQIGWIVPKGVTRARLVWSIPYQKVVYRDRGLSISGNCLMLDAATGERLP